MLKLMVSIEASTDGSECKNVACPKPEICPDDSSLKLVPKHHSHHYHLPSSRDTIRTKRALVYGGRQRETIKIIPGAYDHHSRKRSTTDDELLFLHCCPQYECVCKPNYCDQECPEHKIPANTTNPTEQFGVPGNCCVRCEDTYCMHNGKFRKHGEKWLPEECTECQCENGAVSCLETMCKTPSCLHHKKNPGECCPVCDYEKTNFCGDVRYCSIMCKYGYERQGNCDLCQCARAPPNGSTVSYPEVKSTTAASNVADIIRKGPHQSNSYDGINYHFWISLLLCLVVLSLAIVLTVGYCHLRRSAKYSTVQIA